MMQVAGWKAAMDAIRTEAAPKARGRRQPPPPALVTTTTPGPPAPSAKAQRPSVARKKNREELAKLRAATKAAGTTV